SIKNFTTLSASDTTPPIIKNESLNVTEILLNETVRLNATVTDEESNVTSVKFKIKYPNGTAFNFTASNTSGDYWIYNFSDTAQRGTYNWTYTYATSSGGTNTTTPAKTFNASDTPSIIVTINNTNPSRPNAVNLKAHLINSSNIGIEGQNLTFKNGTTLIGSDITNASGWAEINWSIASEESLGNHTINVTYAGNSTEFYLPFYNNSDKVTVWANTLIPIVNINNTNPSSGDLVKIDAKLQYDNETALSNQTLTFYNGTTLIGSGITNVTGWATINWDTSGCSGTYTINATYSENSNLYTLASFNNSEKVTVTSLAVPNITSWGNNKTKDQSNSFTINTSEVVMFNATANQTIDTWNWYKEDIKQDNNYDNFTTSWSIPGTKTVKVNATNANGTSNTIQWNITVKDIQKPEYSKITSNNSEVGLPTLLSAYWTDNVGLDGFNLSTNNSGTWINTSYNLTGKGNWSNDTIILNSTPGITIGWRIYARDTSGNWNDTGIQLITTKDTTPPYYSKQGQNKSNPSEGELVKVYAYWTDNIRLASAILATNKSGTWSNESMIAISAQKNWSNFTLDTDGYGGKSIAWKIYANDTSDNWNVTEEMSLFILSPAGPNITSFAPTNINPSNNEKEKRTFNITIDQVVNVSWTINGSEVQKNNSVSEAYYTNTSAVIGYWNVSAIVTNENGSDIQTWMWSVKDITPPSSIKNLQNKTGLTWINWTWNNPSDQDFNHTMIYLDGVFKINTSLNYYNATSLNPNTTHTISTHTVDKYGNINATWINQTTSTLKATGKVSGWVIDEKGKPIKKANISLNGTSISTETDKNGYYFLTAPVGNYTITASYKKHENQSKNITLIKDQTIIVNFTLIKHVSGKGKVVDDDDKPLNLSIKVRGPDGKWIHIKDDANEFDWDDLPNGSEIIFDALDIKNVSAKFKIYDNATNAVIKLDKYANNPEPSNPPGTSIKYVKVNATNVSYEKVEISISYTDAELGGLNENNLKILHYKNGKWNELATSVDKANNTITATTTSLSTFAVIQPSGADTYVREDQSTTNYGTAPNMYVRSKTGSRSHAFIKFDLSSIPRGSNIISANLSLYMYTAPTASRTYNIYKITSDWNETTITWNNAPTVSATPTSSSSTGTTNNVWLNWSVTSDVQYFLDNPSNNYGWMINDSSEGSADYFANFSSKENATSSLRPKIYVEYKIPPYRAKVYVIKTRSYDQREAARNGNISYYYSGPSATFMVDPTNWSDAYYFDILDGNNVDYWWYPKATIRILLL
ncbi:MAG: DNRLRE domain-containing protein, partial [Methanosarcinales archaeon]